ncbi:ATP-binding cassette domain-containing protein [Helicobacter jaachi]|uniref:ATP-binding cassette domain-containing protein n=1 Tax=Helicobacter jaachi TaxID=1677920 RepID=A0A4U8T9U4_9HELI|nr:ATP-binding cassette domain-containing protein [Helicobacter jaachi]TLD96610.1 ATP-binding cassette domain-containing protein [Helicobacter jaachi]
MLDFINVSYAYRSYRLFRSHKKEVLRHINFTLESGTNLAIMGPSGSGKSTLAQIACGLLRPSVDEHRAKGEVRFNGKTLNLRSLSARRAFYSQVQILFQDSLGSLNPYFSCYENLIEPLIYLQKYRSQSKAHLYELLEIFGLSKDVLHKNVAMISGGQAQRICLIRALLVNPQLLILDESTSGLDYELCLEVIDFLKRWSKESSADSKRSILLITHDAFVAQSLCDEIKTIHNGHLQALQ